MEISGNNRNLELHRDTFRSTPTSSLEIEENLEFFDQK